MDSIFINFYQQICNNIPLYLLAIFLLVFVLCIKKKSRLSKANMVALLITCTVLSLASELDKSIAMYFDELHKYVINLGYKTTYDFALNYDLLETLNTYKNIRYICACLAYGLRILLTIFLYFVIDAEASLLRRILIVLPVVITIALFVFSPLTHWCFYFDDLNYYYQAGPLHNLIYVTIIIDVMHILAIISKKYKNKLQILTYLIFIFATTFTIVLLEAAGVIEAQSDIINMIFLIDVASYYLLMESYVHYEEMEEKEKALYESKVVAMTNQVRPHFIFNCISNIIELCDENSKARKALIAFSKYLRVNINSLNDTNPTLFDNELMYIENFIFLEKMRYPDKFAIAYNIKTSDFLVPSISIEIFVENAIKHNVGRKENIVHVFLKTSEEDDYYVVQIKDDGVGFNVEDLNKKGSVGINNAKYRLENKVNAQVSIDSVINEGTNVVIKIPKEKDER